MSKTVPRSKAEPEKFSLRAKGKGKAVKDPDEDEEYVETAVQHSDDEDVPMENVKQEVDEQREAQGHCTKSGEWRALKVNSLFGAVHSKGSKLFQFHSYDWIPDARLSFQPFGQLISLQPES